MSDAQRAAVAHALSAPEDARTILRVSATAGEDEIRRAYRRACILLHPDKNPLPDAAAAFQRVERAKTALANAPGAPPPPEPRAAPTGSGHHRSGSGSFPKVRAGRRRCATA